MEQSVAEIQTKIEETVISILKSSDMDEMTEFKVRKMAGEKLGLDLSEHKKFVRKVVESFLLSTQQEQEEEEEAEPNKETKEEQVEEAEEKEEEEEEDEEEKKTSVAGKEYDDDGDLIICRLSNKRRVTIQDFRGKTLVSIREYYEKDGKQLPSSKGISLTAEQWSTFKKAVPAIEDSIKKVESRLR